MSDTARAMQWTVTLAVGGPHRVYGRKPITAEQAIAYLTYWEPDVVVTDCQPYFPPPKSVWDGRNAYRDANPDWWRWLYGD